MVFWLISQEPIYNQGLMESKSPCKQHFYSIFISPYTQKQIYRLRNVRVGYVLYRALVSFMILLPCPQDPTATVTVPIPATPCSLPSSYSSPPHQSVFSDPLAASVPKSVIPRPVPSSYYLLTHQSGFSSSTSMAEQNTLHDMSVEELKQECQNLYDKNRQLQLRVSGVNELARLLQSRSELVQVLEEKNKRLEIAVMRLENKCAAQKVSVLTIFWYRY